MKLLLLTLLILFMTNAPIFAQSASFDWEDAAQDSDSMSEDAWNRRVINGGSDYLLYRYSKVSKSDLNVNVSQKLTKEEDCVGYTTSNAFYAVSWYRDNLNESKRLRFFAVSRDDTVLVIRQPDGSWICNDNYNTTQHPLIDIVSPRTGTYYVWVTNKTRNQFGGDLFVTLENHNPRPGQYPTNPETYLIPSNPASGATAQIVYVDVRQTSKQCNISVDVRIANMDGYTQIRLVIYPLLSNKWIKSSSKTSSAYSLDGYIAVVQEPKDRPRFGVTNYDYGRNNYKPFELQISDSVMPNDIQSYQLEIVLQQEINKQWYDMVTYRTSNSKTCRPK